MSFWVVFETATGRLVSTGSVLAEPLPAGLTATDLGARPADTLMWDAATRTHVARPAKVLVDRLQDLIDDPVLAEVWSRLTANQRTILRNRVVALLGRQRWRVVTETVNLE